MKGMKEGNNVTNAKADITACTIELFFCKVCIVWIVIEYTNNKHNNNNKAQVLFQCVCDVREHLYEMFVYKGT